MLSIHLFWESVVKASDESCIHPYPPVVVNERIAFGLPSTSVD